jgi:hypothetical protein
MQAFQVDAFQPDAFQEQGVVADTHHAGLLFDRKMTAVPYQGPPTGARVITRAEIAAAQRRFSSKRTEEEWILGLITDAQWLEAA